MGMGQAPLFIWAERGFGPEALKLISLFSDFLQIPANSKIMRFVSKFKLEIPLAWQGCAPPGHVILLGLGLLFPIG
jgi:hypothetical protein